MNGLIYQADVRTHVKIVTVALAAAIAVAMIGIKAHIGA